MKLLFYFSVVLFIIFNFYLLSFSVIHGDVNFINDVGRDFLLLQEMDHKKIVLIGPRSNTQGLFHGPLWTYINYPAYVLGNGNPVFVAWYWIFLSGLSFLTGFLIARKLFGLLAALFYVLLLQIMLVPFINGIFHSIATFFFVPAFFFTVFKYFESKKNYYLVLHLITSAIIIQLNVGVGSVFFVLSSLVILIFIVKNKRWKHLLTFLLIPLFLSNFIIFDLLHHFQLTKAVLSINKTPGLLVPFNFWVRNRIDNTISLQVIPLNSLLPYVISGMVLLFSVIQIKKNKDRLVYLLFIYYYFGYMLLTFFNKGVILFHFVFLLIPLTTLWLVSFLSGKFKYLFAPIIFIVILLNLNTALNYIKYLQTSLIGKHYNSWLSLSAVAQKIIKWQEGKEFGYFVYAPDAYAYQPRYAMIYNFKVAKAHAFEYIKKPTTYVIAAPPPADNPYMTTLWWIRNEAKISNESAKSEKFPSGFTVEKFNLNAEEQKIQHDKNIELGIHFR